MGLVYNNSDFSKFMNDWYESLNKLKDASMAQTDMFSKAVDILSKESNLDIVSVTRCKNCKHKQDKIDSGTDKDFYCDNLKCHVKKDFYCKDGEADVGSEDGSNEQ